MPGKRTTPEQHGEILRLLAEGRTQREVAETLGISEFRVHYAQKKKTQNNGNGVKLKIPGEVIQAAARAAADQMYAYVLSRLGGEE